MYCVTPKFSGSVEDSKGKAGLFILMSSQVGSPKTRILTRHHDDTP